MEGVEHRTVSVNGINMHVAEKGEGPLILFIHGFPDLWYTWRHQIAALASLGYRCVAPDLRGFGDTEVPHTPTSYTSFHVVGDLIGLLDAIAPDQEKVFVVGHDWGALMAWYLCQYRPERVKALVNLSVAFTPRHPKTKPLHTLRTVYGNDYYICRFQEPGDIEAEFAQIGTARVLKEFLTYRNPGPLYLPKGKGFGHPIDSPIVLPSWLSEEECSYYATKYEKTGFTGGLNYYRNLDLNWELAAPWTGAQIKVPVKFIVGDIDLTYNAPGAKDYIHKGGFKRDVPLLEDVVVIEGAGHFIQQERGDEINKHIYDFFRKFYPSSSESCPHCHHKKISSSTSTTRSGNDLNTFISVITTKLLCTLVDPDLLLGPAGRSSAVGASISCLQQLRHRALRLRHRLAKLEDSLHYRYLPLRHASSLCSRARCPR